MKWDYKFSPKKATRIVYLLLLFIGIILTIGRWYSVIDNDFVIINSEIHSHISNFTLSLIAYLAIGYTWLLSGISFRIITILGIGMIIANFICETLMGFMNTTDIIDAIYGTIGILVVFVYLLISKKYGIVKNNIKEEQKLRSLRGYPFLTLDNERTN